MWQALNDLEREVLQMIVIKMGWNSFTWSQLESYKPRIMSGAELKMAIVGLLHKKVITTYQQTWGDKYYAISKETFKEGMVLHHSTLPSSSQINPIEAQNLDFIFNDIGILEDLFQLCTYIELHEVEWTSKNKMHQRHINRIVQRLSLQASKSHFSKISLDIVLKLASILKLIEPSSGRLLNNEDRLGRWLQLDAQSMQTLIRQEWEQLFPLEQVWQQHIYTILEQIPYGQWMPMSNLVHWLTQVISIDAENGKRNIEQSFLYPLTAFGFMELVINRNDDQVHFFRWIDPAVFTQSQSQKVNKWFYVLLNFDIMTPHRPPFFILWELELLADRSSYLSSECFQIRPTTIWRAMEHGRTVEDILRFLTTFSHAQVPQQVEKSIRQWGHDFTKTRLDYALLLRCKDEADTDTLFVMIQEAKIQVERIGTSCLVIDAASEKEIIKCLANWGYPPLSSSQAKRRYSQFVYSEEETLVNISELTSKVEASPMGQIDSLLPQIEDIYPNLQAVPSIWYNSSRQYHLSVRRQIVEQALQWSSSIKLTMSGNLIQTFLPAQIIETGRSWQVRGTVVQDGEEDNLVDNLATLAPDDWEEIQLILPGINVTY